MNISGWVWVIPGDYVSDVTPSVKPVIIEPSKPNSQEYVETYIVRKGDTLGAIARRLGWYSGSKMFGDDGYAQSLAEYNNIINRGLIYPGQVIRRK
jgi:nucleoid-associated protein YgaU